MDGQRDVGTEFFLFFFFFFDRWMLGSRNRNTERGHWCIQAKKGFQSTNAGGRGILISCAVRETVTKWFRSESKFKRPVAGWIPRHQLLYGMLAAQSLMPSV